MKLSGKDSGLDTNLAFHVSSMAFLETIGTSAHVIPLLNLTRRIPESGVVVQLTQIASVRELGSFTKRRSFHL